MDYEIVFSAAGTLAMVGWLVLLASPWVPEWSDRIAGLVIPALLAALYLGYLIFLPPESGGFGSFADVKELFSNPQALMAGWIHFLAFDLFVGAWICRTARAEGIPFWFILPCLPTTFLFGPVGFLMFTLVRGGRRAIAR